jgi:uncharacterized protein (TIGR01370 family)
LPSDIVDPDEVLPQDDRAPCLRLSDFSRRAHALSTYAYPWNNAPTLKGRAMPRTGLYQLQGVDPAEVAAAPFDVKVVDIYANDGTAFTPAQVHQMGGGPGSALLLGYFSIGEAETYRDYYSTIPKAALGPEDPQWKGNYEVAYWTPEWRQVATAYIDKMIAAGYDGAYFDVVDEYQLPWAQSHAPGGAIGAEQAMVDLVENLAAHARAISPGFKIWVNGGEGLLSHGDYLQAIDGLYKENVYYTDGGEKQSAAWTAATVDQLHVAVAAGKDVVAVEYVSGADKVADVQAQAGQDGFGSYVAHLNLDDIDYEGVLPGQAIRPDGSSSATSAAVARLYYGILNRAADAGGLQTFAGFVDAAGPAGTQQALNAIADAMLSSSEHAARYGALSDAGFIASLYQGALGRAPDASGAAFFADQLAHGVSRATVAIEIAESPEAQVHLVGQVEQGFHLFP